jgi:hypothetical protein
MSGPSGVVNPRHGELRPIADEALIQGAEALLELSDNIDMIDWSRRTFGFAVLSGIQVDQFGNLNTVAVGTWANTGFELAEGADVQPTIAPDPDELEILRTVVDRTGVLRRKSGAS